MTSLQQLQPGGAAALDRVRGRAPTIQANVRRLAAFANVHSCPTAAVAFAARIDTNKVLAGTSMEMPFGQSPFAIGRGVAFEALLRRHGHAELRRVLTEGLRTDFSLAAIENLREGYQPNRAGLAMRARVTSSRMAEIAEAPQEPVVLDGAVLRADIGGLPGFFEADEMAIGVGGQIIVGENKSWPVVDGRPTDEDALGAALDQAATYVLMGRRTLEQSGVDSACMSEEVVLVTPRNTGLAPVLHRQDVSSRIRRIDRLLGAVPDVQETAASTPSSVTFDTIADTTQPESLRLDAFQQVTDELGRVYDPANCLTSCGFAWACRYRMFAVGDPAVVGGSVARALPGIAGLSRVAELGQGAPASPAEAPAAMPLARARRLYDEIAAVPRQAQREDGVSTALEALFAARIYSGSQALRRTTLRHVHLADPPMAIAIWRLGGERFRAAAIAWGPLHGPFQLAVPGEPRNRDMYFAALQPFAADLCARVRRAAVSREVRQRGSGIEAVPTDALQIVVANRATVSALGLLGRYLAYLSDRGGTAPAPALMEAGSHLRFYARNARVPGQALLLPLDRLVADHWATLLSPFEQANLAALDAQIEPGPGRHPFDASAAAEASARIGPEPTEDIDRRTDALLADFNAARGTSTDPAAVGPLAEPLREHYRGLVEPVWHLMQRVVERERQLAAAPSVARRFEADREAFGRHVDWVIPGGYYRTTDTPRQAAITLRRLEDALAHYEADRAVDDPACMIPYLLDGDAIRGTVASVAETKVVVKVRAVSRAVIAVDSPDSVTLPEGKLLWWTATAGDQPWRVESVQPNGTGSRVVLMLTAKPTAARLPAVADVVTLSTLCTGRSGFWLMPPADPPWTHRPDVALLDGESIDAGDSEQPAAAVDGASVPDPGRYT